MHIKNYRTVTLLTVAAFLLFGMVYLNANRPLAYVQKFKPVVSIENNQKEIKAEKAGPLFDGDTLLTDTEGYALVQFMDKSFARVKPQSMLIVRGEIRAKGDQSSRLGLEAGEIFLNVTKQANTEFEVATATSVASVKGTAFGAKASGYFWVVEGEVELRSNRTGQTTTLTDNEYGEVNEDGSIETGRLSDEEADSLSQGYDQLDSQLETKTIRFRFRDENGQIREVELKYYINN